MCTTYLDQEARQAWNMHSSGSRQCIFCFYSKWKKGFYVWLEQMERPIILEALPLQLQWLNIVGSTLHYIIGI